MRTLIASSIMPRTTLDLDPSVLSELRQRGSREGKSMGDVASELLARALADRDALSRPRKLRWISKPMGAPLVDLDDKEAVHAVLDGRA